MEILKQMAEALDRVFRAAIIEVCGSSVEVGGGEAVTVAPNTA